MNRIINKLGHLYRSLFWSLEKQARYAGVKMGENNFIASRFWSSEAYLITIGSNCQITGNSKLFTHGGGGAIRNMYPDYDSFGKVSLGNYVYVGNNVLIMPGVSIGDNVLIAAGSVVTKSIPSNTVVAGNPARYICSIEDYIKKNLRYNTHTKPLDPDRKKKFLLTMDEEMFIQKDYISMSQ